MYNVTTEKEILMKPYAGIFKNCLPSGCFSRKVLLALIAVLTIGLSGNGYATGVSVNTQEENNEFGGSQGSTELKQPEMESLAGSKVGSNVILYRNKLGRDIRKLLNADAASSTLGAKKQESLIEISNARIKDGTLVQVYIELNEYSQINIDRLIDAGLDIEIENENLKKIQGWVAIGKLDMLTAYDFVKSVRSPSYGQPNIGSKRTQGDIILRTNKLRAMGYSGKGVRVGIISDGFNDWRSAQRSGDLPAGNIKRYGWCEKKQADPGNCIEERECNEATAMAEIVYDIAPNATLALVAAGTSLELISKINTLVNDFKADIIVDDYSFYSEPYFEDGDVAKAVRSATRKVLYITSAGNQGDGHYEKQYLPKSNGSGYHNFGGAEGGELDSFFRMTFIPGKARNIFLQWNDPFDNSTSDYDLYLVDDNGDTILKSTNYQSGAGYSPYERIWACNRGSKDVAAFVRIKKQVGMSRRLEMFSQGWGSVEYNHPQGSVFGHAAVPSVIAVGAIQARDPGNNTIAPYSSRGPARIDFPSIQFRNKPDVVAIDGVSVTGAGGFSTTFYGTSASAPHVAGMAALLMSISPKIQATQVRNTLMAGAVDLGAIGFDRTYGYGRVDAINSFRLLKYGILIPPIIQLLLL